MAVNLCTALVCVLTLHALTGEALAYMVDCCSRYSKTELPCGLIKGYEMQSSIDACDINAVIFHTKRGRKICANPKDGWVLKRIQCVGEKVKRMSASKKNLPK
ncbi:C-C motif chemokine 20-like [Erpetoichthys calabaricus]|uniref:C-C motif chemokine 20-like n=1 Tax=Erpetoichthys calabaricus TaxID=27687 RepID=A0A8C4RY77_ERPCA|nr:C-C motif chemokine 20-like [Erpetoichthys calabaricus]